MNMKRPLITLITTAAMLLPAAACENCFREVPSQPADGTYYVSAELPDEDCFWLYLAELRPEEDLATFCERAVREQYAQHQKKFEREWRSTEDEDGRTRWEPSPDAPDVLERGLVLRNPAAPEAWRDVIIPSYRDNMMDFPSSRERFYNLFLSIRFSRQGITARHGKGSIELARATAPPRFWPWSESEAFLAELPQMLFGDPAEVETRPNFETTISKPLRERVLSGRRMVLLHTDKGMPIAPHWECLARMVSIVGGQNMGYYKGETVFDGIEYERRERKLMAPLDSTEEPRPDLSPILPPEIDVHPELALPDAE